MARSIWKGAISFGLVNIPVSLYSAEAPQKELDFTLLDKKDMAPVGYKKVNKASGEEVPKDRLVKGFEVEEGRFVVVGEEDFKRAAVEKTQRVDIRAFVDLSEIDPALFSKPYYLEPAAKADKAYALLREALRRAGKAGIATVVLRSRENICALIPRDELLLLEMLRFPDELRDPHELALPPVDMKKAKLSEAELKMAERLIADLEAPFQAGEYHDEYRQALLDFIKKKAEAGEAELGKLPAKEARLEPPADIMKLLKASVAQAGRKGGDGARRGRVLH